MPKSDKATVPPRPRGVAARPGRGGIRRYPAIYVRSGLADFAIDSLVRREFLGPITMRTNIESGVFTADCGWLIYITIFAVVAYANAAHGREVQYCENPSGLKNHHYGL